MSTLENEWQNGPVVWIKGNSCCATQIRVRGLQASIFHAWTAVRGFGFHSGKGKKLIFAVVMSFQPGSRPQNCVSHFVNAFSQFVPIDPF